MKVAPEILAAFEHFMATRISKRKGTLNKSNRTALLKAFAWGWENAPEKKSKVTS